MATDLAHIRNTSVDQAPEPSIYPADRRKMSRFYRPELDVLRFFAFFSVFLAHGVAVNTESGVLRHHPVLARTIIFVHHLGGFGLSLFFFLSSFLITTLLLIEHERTGTVHMGSFYTRRILRIWPLYLSFLIVAFITGQLWAPAHVSARALLAYLTLSANWYVIAAGVPCISLQYLWSISVEEQFYLLWPTAVRFLDRDGIRIFCLGLSVVSMAGIATLAATHATGLHIWFNSVTETLFFATGGLMALRFGLRKQLPSWSRFFAGTVACFVSWAAAESMGVFANQDYAQPVTHIVPFYLLAAFGVASLMWAFLHIPRSLVLPPLVYLGRISFGLYVFHGLMILVGGRVLPAWMHGGIWLIATFMMTFALAALSYEFLEKPFLRWKHRFEVVHSRAA